MSLRGTSIPRRCMVLLNSWRSSPRLMASTFTPITFTPYFSSTPSLASSEERLSPVCPPRFGSKASGLSFSMISVSVATLRGSM